MSKRNILLGLGVIVAVLILLGSGFSLGLQVGEERGSTLVIDGVSNIENQTSADFDLFWQAWKLVERDYLKSDEITNEKRVYGAVAGLIRSLDDPYSEFFPPLENKKFQEDIEGNFGGIGAQIGVRKGNIAVVTPLKDSPAMRAGLRSDDLILFIDSTPTEGLSLDRAVQTIRGEIGSTVVLTILRDGWERPREFSITRERIITPTLDFELKEGGIAHVELYSFNANAERLLHEALFVPLANGSIRGIVLDLRDNPGGYLEVAADLAGWFLERGQVVVREVGRGGKVQAEFRANGNTALADIPLVVLVNGGSASAAEILAGTLRDNRGVTLVGETTFGKGTVQQLEELSDGSSVKLTIAHWVLPKGHILEEEGLVPDVEVVLTEADVEAKRDPQLEKAIEELRKLL